MLEIKIPYYPEKSNIFGTIKRPLVTMKLYSKIKHIWIPVYGALADTGADITLLPRYLGEMIVEDITTGEYAEIKGVVPTAVLIGFIHTLKLEVFRREFETKAIIAHSDEDRPILGRFQGIDLFEVTYNKGKEMVIKD